MTGIVKIINILQTQYDIPWFLTINYHLNTNQLIGSILSGLSCFFTIYHFCFYYFCTLGYYILLYKKYHKPTLKIFIQTYFNILHIGFSYFWLVLIYSTLKLAIGKARPFCSLLHNHYATILLDEKCFTSFPSAHVGIATLIAYFIWHKITKLQKSFTGIMVILVALSRITLSMHYPSDIIAGFLIMIFIIRCNKTFLYMLQKPLLNIGNYLFYTFINK